MNFFELSMRREFFRMAATTSFDGRPAAENTGSFCPRTRVFRPSMGENPVSMKSSGRARAEGLIGAPVIGVHFSGMNIGAPSFGSKDPLNILPTMSDDRGTFLMASVKDTEVRP